MQLKTKYEFFYDIWLGNILFVINTLSLYKIPIQNENIIKNSSFLKLELIPRCH